MQPVTCHFPPTDNAEDNLETIEEIEFISELDPGPDEVLLGDVLEGGDNDEEDNPPDTLPAMQLVWWVPEIYASLMVNLCLPPITFI